MMAFIRPAAAGSAATATGALLALLAAAAVLCSAGSSWATATGDDEAELLIDRRRQVVPAMYVFGDSLVDVGNNDFLPEPAPRALPPNGVDLPRGTLRRRFTNGYNFADMIAQHVGFRESPPAYLSLTPSSSRQLVDLLLQGRVGTNYASAGSGILDATRNGTISLRQQVELFAKTKATILRAGLVSRESLDGLLGRSLFVISTGGNDFNAFVHSGLPMSRAPEFMAALVADYLEYIHALYKLGARRLVLLGIAPIGCLPSQRATTADGECDGDQNYLSVLFNAVIRAEMAKAVVSTSMPAMSYSIANIYNLLSDLIHDPTLAGLREAKTACCGGGKFNGEVDCSVDTSLCVDRDEYVFWNMVHGTQAAYRWAFHAYLDGTSREAEPINLRQLLQEQYSTTTA